MKRIVFLWIIAAAVIIAGCGGTKPDAHPGAGPNASNQANSSGGSFPVTFIDDAGIEVTIEEEPQRIISIQASITEISFALGLGDKIVGVSEFDNYPEEAKTKETVGARNMDAEKILSLQPDVVFVTDKHFENYNNVLDQFRSAGIDVIVIGGADSFEDAYQNMRMIAEATGTGEKAEEMIADMETRLEAIREKAQSITTPKRVWIEVSPAPDIFTTGKGTFMHEMLESIGAVNVAGDHEGWIKFTEEQIVNLMPEVIITTYGYYVDDPAGDVMLREGWQEVPAIRNKQVFDVDNDTVTRPGPRLIDGVETLAEFIYPETFK